MSNYLAIATVTATLQRTLQAIVQVDVEGARVTTVRPDAINSGSPETGVNIYLYHVVPNPNWRNADLRTRYSDGKFAKRPQAALDLYYLLSCYGNEIELEPQRLLGSVIRTLHARPTLTAERIRETLADSTFPFLTNSNLSEQVEVIHFMPLSLGVDELSNIWSVMMQTPHALSMAYQAGVVLIESDDIPQRALPVRDRSQFAGMPFGALPVIERITAQSGKLEPIVAESTLLISGTRLHNKQTSIRIGTFECTPHKVEDSQIIVQLADIPDGQLRAGLQGLQVIHRLSSSSERHRGVESNVVPVAIRPSIREISISNLDDSGDDLRTADVSVQTNVTIGKTQRAVLLLNELSTENPSAYLFDAKLRDRDTDCVTFAIYDVKPGTYLVRIQIDGAESLLNVDTTPTSPTYQQYISPTVTID